MWIVRLALRRPYTFVVMALLVAILGGVAIATMPVDIFPYIDIPIVSIVWQYNGLPPGTFPPQVLKYDAASVPILQLGLSSTTLKEQEIFDLAQIFIRTPLATVQGANVSYPFGGKNPQIMVDLNLDELYAKQL